MWSQRSTKQGTPKIYLQTLRSQRGGTEHTLLRGSRKKQVCWNLDLGIEVFRIMRPVRFYCSSHKQNQDFHSQYRSCLSWISCFFPYLCKCAGDKISSNNNSNFELLVLLPPSPECWDYRHAATMPGSCSSHSTTFLASNLPCPLRLSFNAS